MFKNDSPLRSEHGQLMDAASRLVHYLGDFREHLVRGRVGHLQHDEFADRAQSLSLYLASVGSMVEDDHYLPAFSVLRTSLEQHLTDRLLFLGRRYRQRLQLSRPDYEQWLEELRDKSPGTEDIAGHDWNSGTLTIIRRGLHLTGGTKGPQSRTLSVYYFLLKDFDPFVGSVREQKHLSRGFTPLSVHQDHARSQQTIYGGSLRWPAIKDNLAFNRLCTAEDLKRFEVHYRFLSAFVHPVPRAFDEVYGRNRPTDAPRYDHYSSELVLLYMIKIASAELQTLKKMTARTPRVQLSGWDKVEADIKRADGLAEHLWFPGSSPHYFDFVEEANSRGLRGRKPVPREKRPSPDQLEAAQVHYYRNPLRRLIRMHASFNEMTGFSYISALRDFVG